jgi:hypothetical protein
MALRTLRLVVLVKVEAHLIKPLERTRSKSIPNLKSDWNPDDPFQVVFVFNA